MSLKQEENQSYLQTKLRELVDSLAREYLIVLLLLPGIREYLIPRD
jgi:hypothetical protein